MDYKYYTERPFAAFEQAVAFSQSYQTLSSQDITTPYRFPISTLENHTYCVVVYDLNELKESDIPLVSIQKVNTDFLPLT